MHYSRCDFANKKPPIGKSARQDVSNRVLRPYNHVIILTSIYDIPLKL